MELIGLHSSGAVLRLDASIGAAMQGGKPVSICILRDVSARREAEIHRGRLYGAAKRARHAAEAMCLQAERANKAKSDFLAMVSHELRTPLTAILGYTELVVENPAEPLSNTQRAHLGRIGVNSDRLLTLINEILTFSAADAGNNKFSIADVPVSGLIAVVADAVAPSAQKQGLVLTLAAYDPTLMVRADGDKLQQVLSNVLANAVKFTAPEGRIDLSCEAAADVIRIRIRDTGCGMPADRLNVIFDPFVQLDTGLTRKHGGVGLGLAISREFVRGMGGWLEVESTLGVGTVFTISLPRATVPETLRLPTGFNLATGILAPAMDSTSRLAG